jgi:hypothetical protein
MVRLSDHRDLSRLLACIKGEHDNPRGGTEGEGNAWMFGMPVPGGDRSVVLSIPAVSFMPSLCQACLLFQAMHAGNEILDQRIAFGLIAGQDVHAAAEVAHVRMGSGELLYRIIEDALHLI